MSLQLIDLANIAAQLQLQLQEHVELRDVKNIERASELNVDRSRAPWVGIYVDTAEFDPHTLGRGAQNWLAQVSIDVIVQEHGDGGQKSEDKLGPMVQKVLNAMIDDLTFRGTVDMIKKFKVQRVFVRDKGKTMDFQHAIISVTAEVRA